MSSRTKNADGTVVQSFTVSGASPQQIITWYVKALDQEGWSAASGPHAEGHQARRETWKKVHRTLVVSTSRAPALGSTGQRDDTPTSQYSFVLAPHGVSIS